MYVNCIFPSKKWAPGHVHEVVEEVMYCMSGVGEIVIDGKNKHVEAGTVVYIPPKSLHAVNNTGKNEMQLFCVFSPSIKVGEYKDYDNK